MPVSAAASSAVARVLSAPLTQMSYGKMVARAADYVDAYLNGPQDEGDIGKIGGVSALADELGIGGGEAYLLIRDAEMIRSGAAKPNYGAGGGGRQYSSIESAPVINFDSPDQAKAYAQTALQLLKNGIDIYNRSAQYWTPAKQQEAREQYWQDNVDSFLRHNEAATPEQAAAFADKALRTFIAEGGAGGRLNDSILYKAKNTFDANFVLDGPLWSENADGTLSLNKVTVRDRAGSIVLEIGSDLAQNLDKVA